MITRVLSQFVQWEGCYSLLSVFHIFLALWTQWHGYISKPWWRHKIKNTFLINCFPLFLSRSGIFLYCHTFYFGRTFVYIIHIFVELNQLLWSIFNWRFFDDVNDANDFLTFHISEDVSLRPRVGLNDVAAAVVVVVVQQPRKLQHFLHGMQQ